MDLLDPGLHICFQKRCFTTIACHPERSEGSIHLLAASRFHRSFASLRMTAGADADAESYLGRSYRFQGAYY